MSEHPGLGLHDSWSVIHAADLVQGQEVIAIDADAPIENACEVLLIRGISSAPVYDRASNTFVGMFDYGDLLTYLLLVLKRARIPDTEQTGAIAELLGKAARAESISVRHASDLSRNNPFYSVIPETSLLQIAEVFGSGTHRCMLLLMFSL